MNYGLAISTLSGTWVQVLSGLKRVIARAAAIWRRIEPTQEEIAVKGLKFLKRTLR